MGGCWDIFCEKRPGAALCQVQSVPASSKKDPPLAKEEPSSDAGGISVVTFKEGQK